jgi:hypothetical protein
MTTFPEDTELKVELLFLIRKWEYICFLFVFVVKISKGMCTSSVQERFRACVEW